MATPGESSVLKRGSLKDKVWEVLMKATIPISIIVGGVLIGHEVRISRIEETRFTDSDGLRQEQRLGRWMEDRFPDKEDFKAIVDDIREIKDSVKALEKRK